MKAIIVHTNTKAVDDVRAELLDWARGLGLDTRLATTTFVLIAGDDGWRAHFSLKRQRDGRDYMEPGANRVATDFGCYVVDVDSWPAWFPDAENVPDMAAAELLELLAVAAESASHLKYGRICRDRDTGAVEA